MHTLLLDNYDSFTFNLYQALAALGADPMVYRNDAITMEDVGRMDLTHIVISPGPGSPLVDRDVGIAPALIRYAIERKIPLLGVCLGHQLLGHLHGATVSRAPVPMHGKASKIRITGSQSVLFSDLPKEMPVMRYHSLRVEEDLPAELHVTARSDDDVIMAMEHSDLPVYGVQFHPESIGTPDGIAMLRNFLLLSA